jgi:CDP-diacylglycerol--inositol 3-phosphatidyltransferase
LSLVLAAYFAPTHPLITVLLYATSQWLDAFDGMAARALGQSSAFGAVLDMVCDRASDAIFLSVLSALYPKLSFFFLLAIFIDLVSHWFQTYSTQFCGEAHHKTATTEWRLLRVYYHNKWVLFTMVFGYEVFIYRLSGI